MNTTQATPAEPAHALGETLSTERLSIRPASLEDEASTWQFRRLDDVNDWLTGTPDTAEGYHELFRDPIRLSTTVIVELNSDHGGKVIGDFMFRIEDAWAQLDVAEQAQGRQVELGWVLDPHFTGHGYATEAVRELIRYGFENLGVHRIVADCFLDNEASWRLMERVGMRREKHAVRDSFHRSGGWMDTVAYAILDDEYPRPSTKEQHQ
ncbi:GNAT family protein [Salinibacterium sp. TMP30]|uniref:GNAT family N-acetyltransferase n=1 Tax=Salinibacterium sp. TMP30 TaxID=3138237 RepID=UPI0031394249